MDNEERIQNVKSVFKKQFGHAPSAVVRAPGRVELIGNHTDYNDGFVMPAAINRDVLIAFSAVAGDQVTTYSYNFQQTSEFSLNDIRPSESEKWSNYMRGVLEQMIRAGLIVPGLQMAVEGNVPLGGGLSSSAALEVATAWVAMEAGGSSVDGADVARLCQKAENQFVGVNSGIMDQFISALGREDCAMFLDCRSLDYAFVSLPPDVNIVVADTRKPRTLAGSEYNIRRAQCEEAVGILRQWLPDIKALRDVTVEDLERHGGALSDVVLRRARHVVNENVRVVQCVDALAHGDGARFGQLLSESHASSRDLYEISCPELNWLQEAALEVDGCLGSRLSGAGFGGCTVSIVEEDAVERFRAAVTESYRSRAGIDPDVDVLTAAEGAGVVGKK